MAAQQDTYDSILEHIPKSIPFVYKNKVWRLLNSAGGHDKKIMRTIIDKLDIMHSYYAEVLTSQFILFPPKVPYNNQIISEFFTTLIPYLKRHYIDNAPAIQLGRISYLWVREQSTSDKPHYHCVLWLNEDKINSSYRILTLTKQLWCEQFGGTLSMPDNNYYISKRLQADSGVSLQEVICRLSYLAKNATKGCHSSKIKRYGASKLKNKSKSEQAPYKNNKKV
ncbi:inovirus-type Gp2 protein [Photobacterium phosphoreum]|uniref:YagK/YfjJ domain-containing protein n=1 Tax=Photobacterium phosphoreum TaxID=659 RepID=UPI0039B0C15D